MSALKKKSFEADGFVIVGRIRRSFGVRGQLSADWDDGACPVEIGSGRIYLKAAGLNTLDCFSVEVDHRHGNHNVVTLNGVASRTEADRYRGSEIWAKKADLPRLGKSEYYTYQLLEMRVETTEGEYLGDIASIFSAGSSDVYVVKKGDKEVLIPAVEDVVKAIDVDKGLMVVELIEGLV